MTRWTLEPCGCNVDEEQANKIYERFSLIHHGPSDDEVKAARVAAVLTYRELVRENG